MWRRSNIQPNKSLGWWRLTLILCVFDQLSNSVDRYINNFQIVDNLSDRGSLIIHLFKVKPCRRQSDLPVLHQGEFFSGCVMWSCPSWPAGFTQITLLIQLLGTVSYTLAPSYWTILPPSSSQVSHKVPEVLIFRLQQNFKVGLLQPSSVTVYEYYNPGRRARPQHHITALTAL